MAATIAPAPKRHHRNLVITLAATARKADLAPRHYRIPPTGRQAAEGAFGRFRPPSGSDGALRLGPPARRTPPRRASSSRRRGPPPRRAGRGSPPAPGPMRGRDADAPAPHVLRTNDIDAAGSVAAAGRTPSRADSVMGTDRDERRTCVPRRREEEAGRKRGGGWRPGGRRRRRSPPTPLRSKRHEPADHRESHHAVHRHQRPPRRPRGRSPPRGGPRHRPVRGRNRRNAAMARRPRRRLLRPPSRTRALAAVTSTPVAVRAGRNAAPRPPRPWLPDLPGHQWLEPRFRPWPTSSPPAAPCHPPGPQRKRRTRISALTR